MRISVILAHPDEGSFNHAIARTVVERLDAGGHKVSFHDLYAEVFDPQLTVREIPRATAPPSVLDVHCEEIREAEGIVIVHPDWWGQPPAMMQGWIDRVIRPGIAYEFMEGDSGESVPNSLLRARAALVFNTSNTVPESETPVFEDPLEAIWRIRISGLCGVPTFQRRSFAVAATSTEAERTRWLGEVRTTIDHMFPPRT
jgi:NAD(P)H dehydrogenase (quinone)